MRDQHGFMWQSVKVLNVYNTLTLIQIFWKTKTFLKKLENHFLVQTTKIENISFPFKTASSEANVKTTRMATTKWTYHKEQSFSSNCFILLKICFSFSTSLKELIWGTNDPNIHIRISRKRWSLFLGCFFPVSILNNVIIISRYIDLITSPIYYIIFTFAMRSMNI